MCVYISFCVCSYINFSHFYFFLYLFQSPLSSSVSSSLYISGLSLYHTLTVIGIYINLGQPPERGVFFLNLFFLSFFFLSLKTSLSTHHQWAILGGTFPNQFWRLFFRKFVCSPQCQLTYPRLHRKQKNPEEITYNLNSALKHVQYLQTSGTSSMPSNK